jgi:hypothetical protein
VLIYSVAWAGKHYKTPNLSYILGGNTMKNFYIAVEIKEDGKYYAYAVKASTSDNLLSKLEIKGIQFANLCETKRGAEEVVKMWNAAHKANNRYLFDSPTF